MNVLYRKATIYDYPGILFILREVERFHAEALPELFSSDQPSFTPHIFQTYLSDSSNLVLVAELNGYIIGYSFTELICTPSSPQRCTAFIDYFGVQKTFHRFGIGTKLFEYTKKWAQKKKATVLQLTVWNFNEKAKRFYEKQGMKPVSSTMHMKLDS